MPGIFHQQVIRTFHQEDIIAGPSFKNILPKAAGQCVVARAALQIIIAVIAGQAIAARTAKNVIRVIAAKYRHGGAGIPGIHGFKTRNPGAIGDLIFGQPEINGKPCRENEPVIPITTIQPIRGVLQHEPIIAAAAIKRVGPSAADQAIAAIAADQPVIPCASIQDIGAIGAIKEVIIIAAQQPIQTSPAKERIIPHIAVQQICCVRSVNVIKCRAIGVKGIIAISAI